jgi:hypothetical protein
LYSPVQRHLILGAAAWEMRQVNLGLSRFAATGIGS